MKQKLGISIGKNKVDGRYSFLSDPVHINLPSEIPQLKLRMDMFKRTFNKLTFDS